jgi:hypothetical protein
MRTENSDQLTSSALPATVAGADSNLLPTGVASPVAAGIEDVVLVALDDEDEPARFWSADINDLSGPMPDQPPGSVRISPRDGATVTMWRAEVVASNYAPDGWCFSGRWRALGTATWNGFALVDCRGDVDDAMIAAAEDEIATSEVAS